MSPNVTTDWVPGLEGILVASSLTSLLSRVFTHCRHFTAIKSTPCIGSIADCARKPGARSSVYYRALPCTVDGGSPGARGHTCKYIYIYIYIYIRHPRSHTARLLASLRSAIIHPCSISKEKIAVNALFC